MKSITKDPNSAKLKAKLPKSLSDVAVGVSGERRWATNKPCILVLKNISWRKRLCTLNEVRFFEKQTVVECNSLKRKGPPL